jgi:hypothetical protein
MSRQMKRVIDLSDFVWNFLVGITIIAVIFKLAGIIELPWLVVLAPFLVPFTVVWLVFIALFLYWFVLTIVKIIKDSK